MRTEQLQGVTKLLDILAASSQMYPEMMDNFNSEDIANLLAELLNTSNLKNDIKTIKEIRQLRQQARQQQNQLQTAAAASDINMKNSQAQSMVMGATSGRPKG